MSSNLPRFGVIPASLLALLVASGCGEEVTLGEDAGGRDTSRPRNVGDGGGDAAGGEDALTDDAGPDSASADAGDLGADQAADSGNPNDTGGGNPDFGGIDPNPPAPGLVLEPAEAYLLVIEGQPLPSQAFELAWRDEEGALTPIAAEDADWSIDNPLVGSISPSGVFQATDLGGRTTLTVTHDEDIVVAPVSVALEETLVVAGATDVPALFAGAPGDPSPGPAIVYPLDGVRLPRNVAPIVLQWEGVQGDPYRLTLTSDTTRLTVFTRDWQWQPAEDLWRGLANANAGRTLTLQVDRRTGTGIALGAPIEVNFSFAEVGGAIYYWAPDTNGIVRLPVGETVPEPFLNGTIFNCVGCHALSPDGTRLAYTRSSGGTPIGNLGVIGTDDGRFEYITPSEGVSGYYPTFAPDNLHLAVSRSSRIVIVNTDTGLDVATLPVPGASTAVYPAWSPRGDAIVFSAGTGFGFGPLGSLGISDAGLARVPWLGDAWGGPQWLVQRGDAGGGAENLFYPAYSPDGEWVAFNRALEAVAAGGSPAGSELWLVDSEGGTPIFLSDANGPIGITNSWPKWAPATTDGHLWLAYTSSRPYGRLGGASAQIWITGIVPSEAGVGADPSAPPFWMPFQDPATSNHVAYWAQFTKGDPE